MVVAQLAGLGGEAQVCDGGDGDVGILSGKIEALGPCVFALVLQLQGQRLVLEVGKAGFGGDGRTAETTSLWTVRAISKGKKKLASQFNLQSNRPARSPCHHALGRR